MIKRQAAGRTGPGQERGEVCVRCVCVQQRSQIKPNTPPDLLRRPGRRWTSCGAPAAAAAASMRLRCLPSPPRRRHPPSRSPPRQTHWQVPLLLLEPAPSAAVGSAQRRPRTQPRRLNRPRTRGCRAPRRAETPAMAKGLDFGPTPAPAAAAAHPAREPVSTVEPLPLRRNSDFEPAAGAGAAGSECAHPAPSTPPRPTDRRRERESDGTPSSSQGRPRKKREEPVSARGCGASSSYGPAGPPHPTARRRLLILRPGRNSPRPCTVSREISGGPAAGIFIPYLCHYPNRSSNHPISRTIQIG